MTLIKRADLLVFGMLSSRLRALRSSNSLRLYSRCSATVGMDRSERRAKEPDDQGSPAKSRLFTQNRKAP